MRLAGILGISSFIALAAGCGASSNEAAPTTDAGPSVDPPATTVTGLPCDVDAILAKNCRKCHSSPPQFGAPMALVSHEDLHASLPSDPSRKVFERVPERIADDANPMPQPPNPRLSPADAQTLTSWAAAGAPAGTVDCNSAPPPPTPTVNCKPDLSLAPASAFEMPKSGGDEYVCWGAELTSATPKHITAFAPRIDNTKIVHHIVLFEAPSAVSPVPAKCKSGGSLQWRMVMGWAPGGAGLELPAEAGFPIATTGATHYVVQMHYSNPLGLEGEKDTSGFDFCTSPPRKYEADVVAFGTQDFTIPSGGAAYTRDCSVTVPSQLAGMHLFAAMPHMHQLGTSMSTTLTPKAGGAAVDLGTIQSWSFNSQAWLSVDAEVKTGDVIRTQCTWKNTTGSPVKFGENTADEMCYSFTMYYPKIQSGLWSWALPAATSQCK